MELGEQDNVCELCAFRAVHELLSRMGRGEHKKGLYSKFIDNYVKSMDNNFNVVVKILLRMDLTLIMVNSFINVRIVTDMAERIHNILNIQTRKRS